MKASLKKAQVKASSADNSLKKLLERLPASSLALSKNDISEMAANMARRSMSNANKKT